MWPSPGRNNNGSCCSSPSKSSSSSFSNLSSSPRKPMEEVWKDISLASFNDQPEAEAEAEAVGGTVISTTRPAAVYPGFILQDFLARPLNGESQRRGSDAALFGSLGSLATAPGAILSLNSGSDFHYIDNTTCGGDPPLINGRAAAAPTTAPSFHHHHHVFGSSAAVFPSLCQKKRGHDENNENPNDRRFKRMMKNRESAARSRARKQAYTTELELAVDKLLKENAKLKRQQEKLLAAPAAVQVPKKNTLTRTLTAPF